jgi:S1-C subfamily serine protease
MNSRPKSLALILVVGGLAAVGLVPDGTAVASTSVTAKVDPGVVDVNTNLAYQNAAAAGTGMVIASDGDVLTNNHVIRGATTIKVRDVGNNTTYSASVVGYDVTADIAVLKLRGASGLKTVPIGNSSPVKVGAAVTAIGNAGGTGGTPSTTTGTVTALDQSITAADELAGTGEQLTGLIEMNAPIEAGDSGGPLINAAGKVVGVDTAASSGFQFQAGVNEGFAIPINTAISIANQIETGRISANVHPGATAFLGVDVESMGYFRGPSFVAGALIRAVVPASPAEKAGLSFGDVITALNGKPIASATALTDALLAVSPGVKVRLSWVDEFGTAHSATVTLASGPPQ